MKRRLLLLVLSCAAAALSISAVASAADYRTFVACDGLAAEPVASHVCEAGGSLGAFFETSEQKKYRLCLETPKEELLCQESRLADPGIRYVDALETTQLGYHAAYWFVGEALVGSFVFKMSAHQLEPTAPAVDPPEFEFPPPPVPVPGPAVEPSQLDGCLKAHGQVSRLAGRLGKTTERKPRSRIRTALKAARASVKRACS